MCVLGRSSGLMPFTIPEQEPVYFSGRSYPATAPSTPCEGGAGCGGPMGWPQQIAYQPGVVVLRRTSQDRGDFFFYAFFFFSWWFFSCHWLGERGVTWFLVYGRAQLRPPLPWNLSVPYCCDVRQVSGGPQLCPVCTNN